MNLKELKYCPCTLEPGFSTYSPKALRKLFKGKKVSHILPFDPPYLDEEVAELFRLNRKFLSISGVQVKQSLTLEKNQLKLTNENQRGDYILKLIPHRDTIGKPYELPANEHLTMLIASGVYGIKTADNALIFFKNGEPAYITKRFDYRKDGSKIAQEDFSSLMGTSKDSHGNSFRNEGSYERIAGIVKKYVPAFIIELEKLFERILFNYLVCNGDAHLKNFSLQQTDFGDYVLSPVYDLINTRLHITDDTALALKDGLFENDYNTESFEKNGFYAYDDFYEFGIKIGIPKGRVLKCLTKYSKNYPEVTELINRSFLNSESKKEYSALFIDRLKVINYSYKKIF